MATHKPVTLSIAVALILWLVPFGLLRGQTLPGTEKLEFEGDFAAAMVAGIDQFLLAETAASVAQRPSHWQRDLSSHEKYTASVEPNRQRLRRIIGAVDPRRQPVEMQLIATTERPPVVGQAATFEVLAVRWHVFDGVDGEGLLLRPIDRHPVADCVAIPDADQTPEMLAGLQEGIDPAAQFARRLAENGCRVLIPCLIDRSDRLSLVGGQRRTNQPHREFIYRQAFELGRHIIGYEVQKVLAAIDWFESQAGTRDTQVGVFGYGEGGLLALYAGALDPRIDAVCASGYFDSRQDLWQEPIYRNVWQLLNEFGDAELATLVAPRGLVVEVCRVPGVAGPPAPQDGKGGAAPGRLVTPRVDTVRVELDRAAKLIEGLKPAPVMTLAVSDSGQGLPGSDAALRAFLEILGISSGLAPAGASPKVNAQLADPTERWGRQFQQLVDHTQQLLAESEYTRRDFWSKADPSSLDAWVESTEWYRDYLYREVIGRFDRSAMPPRVRTRLLYEEPRYVAYEVQLDVFPDVFAYGWLLLPRDIRPGERRPCVVCQHGLEGRPRDVADPKLDHAAYHKYACRLAEEGFITYAPQNPYIGQDHFRTLQRKANPLGKSLFSVIVPQHQAVVNWLAELPQVDPARIGFYGLSYGGKTAMRVPPLVSGYALSICSADFNEWIWKNASARSPYSYLGTGEYEMVEFNLGNTFNYSDLAALISPRPFMVERGHRDGVAPDEWVAYEYAKVRRLYDDLGLGDRTTIEFFNGPHTIHGVETFAFLRKHLAWPPGG